MAFKIPRPTYDATVVAKIEEFLDQDYSTEVEYSETYEEDGLTYTMARGRARKSYPRPMFQIIPPGAFSGAGPVVTPCQCDRFDRSWSCELHPEISWDTVRRRWKRPCTGDRTRCECDPCHERRQRAAERSSGYTDMGTDGLRPPQGLYDQLMNMFARPLPQPSPQQRIVDAFTEGCPCAGCRAGRGEAPTRDGRLYFTSDEQENERRRQYERQVQLYGLRPPTDPNEGRPGYHYEAITDRWVRDTSDALGDFRDGGANYSVVERFDPAQNRYVRDPSMNVINLNLMGLDRVPDEINLGPTARDFLGALPDISVTLTGTFTGSFTLEIDSETEQGAGPLAIEVEPSDGSTAA